MGNADRIAIRIAADEYSLGDGEALAHILAIVRAGGEDAMSQISGILTESGRDPSAIDDMPPDAFDPDSGEPIDYDEDLGDVGEGVQELSLIDACLDDILTSQRIAKRIVAGRPPLVNPEDNPTDCAACNSSLPAGVDPIDNGWSVGRTDGEFLCDACKMNPDNFGYE